MIFRIIFILSTIILFSSCIEEFPLLEESDVRYSTTEQMEIPDDANWTGVGLAKELININEQLVFVDLGPNPISTEEWDDFKVIVPWLKNLDRITLFDSSYIARSPLRPRDCNSCEILIEYKGYTWAQLAEIKALSYIPDETDNDKPEAGHLVIKTIKKCQAIRFNEGQTVYELTDNNGNYYIMHAIEEGSQTTDVDLPEGYSISTRVLDEPLFISPFGGGDDCFYNIVTDHLGQGYHQYIYSSPFFPE